MVWYNGLFGRWEFVHPRYPLVERATKYVHTRYEDPLGEISNIIK